MRPNALIPGYLIIHALRTRERQLHAVRLDWATFKGLLLFAILLILCVFVSSARADWYVAGDLFHTQFRGPQVDGTWKQDAIPGGSEFDGASLGWDSGLGYRIGAWSLEAGYRNWGSTTVGGGWVSDHDYRQVNLHGLEYLEQHGIEPTSMSVRNDLQGGYLRVGRNFPLEYGIEPYVSVGVFGAAHTVRNARNPAQVHFTGHVAGPTVGGGIAYQLYQGIRLRVGVDAHWAVTESGNPISSQWFTVGGGIELPLSVGSGTIRDYLWQR